MIDKYGDYHQKIKIIRLSSIQHSYVKAELCYSFRAPWSGPSLLLGHIFFPYSRES